MTATTAAARVWRQLIATTPWGRHPTHLVRDRDRVSGGDSVPRAARLGIDTVLTPFLAPKVNAIAERLVRTFRNECLDRVLILDEQHLHAVLAEDVAEDNPDRPYRSLALDAPLPASSGPVPPGVIDSPPLLRGRYSVSSRAA